MSFRTILAILAAAVFFICGLPVMLVLMILERTSPKTADRISYAFVCWGLSLVTKATGCPVRVVGKENIPRDRGVMFAGNHRSIFDIIMVASILPRPFIIIAKEELGKIPFLHFWMQRIHCLFLNRKDIRAGAQMVADAAEGMKNGNSVLIFPEGTRCHEEGTLLPFKGGSFKIAIRAGAPIVPVTFIGTGNVLEDHPMKVRKTPVTIIFGEPVETSSIPLSERKFLHQKVEDVIARTYEEYAPELWKGRNREEAGE